jgi:hypothetical protein
MSDIFERKIMNTNSRLLTTLLAAAIGLTLTASVMATEVATGADRTSRADYRQAMSSANSDYKTALQACPAGGSERSLCRKEAHTNRNTAIADARARHGMMHTSEDPSGAYHVDGK